MNRLDVVEIATGAGPRSLELCEGDVTAPSPRADLVVITAGPYDYIPVPGSLLAAMYRAQINVARYAAAPAVDRRDTLSYWLSADLTAQRPDVGFKRFLCFEPRAFTGTADVVRQLFNAISSAVVERSAIEDVVLPLVFSGTSGGLPAPKVGAAMFEAAAHWLAIGLPVRSIRVVIKDRAAADSFARVFSDFKAGLRDWLVRPPTEARHDFFISYAHEDTEAADTLVRALHQANPDLRVFLDRGSLVAGSIWQHEIFLALDASKVVIALLTPSYLRSPFCLEEFNIALIRRRSAGHEALISVYFAEASMPTYMTLPQWHDCRESDHSKLKRAAASLAI